MPQHPFKDVSDTATAHWAVTYYTNSSSPRALRWYHVSRVVKVDGIWWELYRWPGAGSSPAKPNNLACVRDHAQAAGLELLAGVFTAKPAPRRAGELVWSVEAREKVEA